MTDQFVIRRYNDATGEKRYLQLTDEAGILFLGHSKENGHRMSSVEAATLLAVLRLRARSVDQPDEGEYEYKAEKLK